MSGGSSSVAGWFSLLEPAAVTDAPKRPDDPRLGAIVETWDGDVGRLRPGRPVLIGFPQDEGVRRNFGRPGAALAPQAIRSALWRLTTWDGASGVDLAAVGPLDAGTIRITGTLEQSQAALGDVVGEVLKAAAIPIVLGGGHETAYGHFLGYVRAGRKVGIVNLDAHLDVRPCHGELGHSGSPFRQALEHPSRLLAGEHYACLGAQPQSVSRAHADYVRQRGGRIGWADSLRACLDDSVAEEIERLANAGCHVHVTLDADVVCAAEVPAVSAPNAAGLSGNEVLACIRRAGRSPRVASFDLVEIAPSLDRDEQSVRWGALAVWQFLLGTAERASRGK